MTNKNLLVGVAGLMAAIVTSVPVYAVPTMMLSTDQGGTWTTITDGGGSDGSAVPDELDFFGFKDGWRVDFLGAAVPGTPELSISSLKVTSRVGGTLIIRYFDTDFGLSTPKGEFKSALSGDVAASGRLSVKTYVDPSNGDFNSIPASAVELTSQGLFFSGTFSGTATSPYVPDAPFSLMIEAKVTHRVGGSTLFSQSLTDPPLPIPDGGATAILLGVALGTLASFSCSGRKTSRNS